MSSYRKGRRFEWRVRDYLERKGWFVARQTRSSFPDLIAIKNGKILLIECKVDPRNFSKREREDLISLAKKLKAKPYLAFRRNRRIVLLPLGDKDEESLLLVEQ